jgi:hypothetical protein
MAELAHEHDAIRLDEAEDADRHADGEHGIRALRTVGQAPAVLAQRKLSVRPADV